MGNRDVVYVHNNIGRTIWAKSRKWVSSHNMRDFRDVATPHDWDVATPHWDVATPHDWAVATPLGHGDAT